MAIYDSWNLSCKSIFGAIKTNESCKFTIQLSPDIKATEPFLVVLRPDDKEIFIPMSQMNDTDKFCAAFEAEEPGLYFYYFAVKIDGQVRNIKKQGAHTGVLDIGTDMFQLTVYDKDFTTPDFIKGGVMYQIFPDRFYKSGKEHKNIPNDRILRTDWGGIPSFAPDNEGKVRNNDYFCGDLDGISQKLDYLSELGVTCLYLNPIFEAHENHRYNTADYSKVDPLLGTNEDFKALCEKADKLGIKIILDGVFSHTGADSVYFNKNKRYSSSGAYNSESSPCFSWYRFNNFPDDYESWWGFPTLPNINETDPSYLEYICGKNGILDYWLNMGASGFRLDVADELPDEFIEALRKTVKENSKNNLVIGEVWEDASNKESYGQKRKYLLGNQLDSVMNYPFKDAILEYMKNADAESFSNRIISILENYPKPSIDTLMNSLSTHDTQRAVTYLTGKKIEDKASQSTATLDEHEYDIGIKLLKCSMVLQFFLPGVPCIYYGDEIGMQGYRDPFNRRCFDWENQNEKLRLFTEDLCKIRNSYDCLKQGEFKQLLATGDTYIFARYDQATDKGLLIYLNKSHFAQRFLPTCDLMEDFWAEKLVRGKDIGKEIEVEPFDYAVYEITKQLPASKQEFFNAI